MQLFVYNLPLLQLTVSLIVDLKHNAISQKVGGPSQSGPSGQSGSGCGGLILGVHLLVLVAARRDDDGLLAVGGSDGLLRNDTWGGWNDAGMPFPVVRKRTEKKKNSF